MAPRTAGRSRLAIVFTVCLSLLTGCSSVEPRTTSPFSGKPVTADELAMEASRWDLEQDAVSAKERLESETQVRKAHAQAELAAKRVTANAEMTLAEIASSLDENIANATAATAPAEEQRRAALASMQASVDRAVGDLRRQREQRIQLLDAVKSIPGVAALPGASTILAAAGAILVPATGAAGIALGSRGKGKAQRRVVAEKTRAEQLTAQLKEDRAGLAAKSREFDTLIDATRSVIESIEKAKDQSEAVREYFALNSDVIEKKQGPNGVALVKDLKRGLRPRLVMA